MSVLTGNEQAGRQAPEPASREGGAHQVPAIPWANPKAHSPLLISLWFSRGGISPPVETFLVVRPWAGAGVASGVREAVEHPTEARKSPTKNYLTTNVNSAKTEKSDLEESRVGVREHSGRKSTEPGKVCLCIYTPTCAYTNNGAGSCLYLTHANAKARDYVWGERKFK